MSNDYFDTFASLVAHTIARSEVLTAIISSIVAGFDKLPTLKRLKEGRVTYSADSGAANAYVLTMPQAPTEYNDGLKIAFIPVNTNTGGSTVNIYDPNALLLGVKAITRFDGNALQAADLPANTVCEIIYNAGRGSFQLQSPITSAASISVTFSVKASGTDTTPSDLFSKLRMFGFFKKAVGNPGSNETVDLTATSYVATGTDTYAITPAPAFTAYSTDMAFLVVFTNGNTGATTLNVNGLGAKALTKGGASPMESGDIPAGYEALVVYDGTEFQMTNFAQTDADLAAMAVLNYISF